MPGVLATIFNIKKSKVMLLRIFHGAASPSVPHIDIDLIKDRFWRVNLQDNCNLYAKLHVSDANGFPYFSTITVKRTEDTHVQEVEMHLVKIVGYRTTNKLLHQLVSGDIGEVIELPFWNNAAIIMAIAMKSSSVFKTPIEQ